MKSTKELARFCLHISVPSSSHRITSQNYIH